MKQTNYPAALPSLPPIPRELPETDTHDQQRREALGLADSYESSPPAALAIYVTFAIGVIAGFSLCLIAVAL